MVSIQLPNASLVPRIMLIKLDLNYQRYQQALARARAMQKEHPESAESYDLLGDIYRALEQPQKAITQYQKSVDIGYSSETYAKLHSAYNLNGQPDQGLNC